MIHYFLCEIPSAFFIHSCCVPTNTTTTTAAATAVTYQSAATAATYQAAAKIYHSLLCVRDLGPLVLPHHRVMGHETLSRAFSGRRRRVIRMRACSRCPRPMYHLGTHQRRYVRRLRLRGLDSTSPRSYHWVLRCQPLCSRPPPRRQTMPALSPMDITTAATRPAYATITRTVSATIGSTTAAATTTTARCRRLHQSDRGANAGQSVTSAHRGDDTGHFRELKKHLGHAPNGRLF